VWRSTCDETSATPAAVADDDLRVEHADHGAAGAGYVWPILYARVEMVAGGTCERRENFPHASPRRRVIQARFVSIRVQIAPKHPRQYALILLALMVLPDRIELP
jgi:hypothetical protein